NDEELQRELHVPPEEYTPMILELRSRDLADCTHESATITFAGIREVERLESNPNQGSANFPAVNVMNVYGGISQSQVQQGSNESTQFMRVTQNEVESLLQFILELEKNLPKINLKSELEQQAKADIATVKSQASAPHPNRTIIRESLRSLRTILEGAAATAIAGPAMEYLGQLKNLIAALCGQPS